MKFSLTIIYAILMLLIILTYSDTLLCNYLFRYLCGFSLKQRYLNFRVGTGCTGGANRPSFPLRTGQSSHRTSECHWLSLSSILRSFPININSLCCIFNATSAVDRSTPSHMLRFEYHSRNDHVKAPYYLCTHFILTLKSLNCKKTNI